MSGRDAPDRAHDLAVPESDDDLLRAVERSCGGVPVQVRASREVLDYFLPILRADLELASAYVLRPGVALDCPITAMVGDIDPLTSREGLERWGRHTGADCECHAFRGGHFYLTLEEEATLSTITRRLLA